jgi:hypothetical protein
MAIRFANFEHGLACSVNRRRILIFGYRCVFRNVVANYLNIRKNLSRRAACRIPLFSPTASQSSSRNEHQDGSLTARCASSPE